MKYLHFLQAIRSDFLNVFFMPAALPLEEIAVSLIAWFVWVGNKKFGWRSMLTMSSGMLLTIGFKNLFRIPRPWIIYEGIEPLYIESATGYSFPSGHSSFAILFCFGFLYPLLNEAIKKRLVSFVLCFLATMYLMFSRLYYNVHTVNDVIAGALLGLSWLGICNYLFNIAEKKASRWPLLFLTTPMFFAAILLLFPSINQQPPHMEDALKLLGMGIVLIPIAIFESVRTPTQEKIKPYAKWAYFLVGIVSVFLIKNSTGYFLRGDKLTGTLLKIMEVIRYSILGLFVLWVYPMVLKLLRGKANQ